MNPKKDAPALKVNKAMVRRSLIKKLTRLMRRRQLRARL